MDVRADQVQYNPYRVFSARTVGRPARRHADDADRPRKSRGCIRCMTASTSRKSRKSICRYRACYRSMSRQRSAFVAQRHFLGIEDRKMPYIIGVAGSVAVGKSTTARVLQALLARWSPRPKVDLVTTDGFLFPNEILEREGLMQKKGFPESYDLPALLSFLVRHQGRTPAGSRAGLLASDV